MSKPWFLLGVVAAATAGLATTASQLPAAEKAFLWQIGQHDTNNAEFALAPGNFAKFSADGHFFVGDSDTKRDWPYVQPGPDDGWAGSRPHTFSILFGLKSAPPTGDCRLRVALLDTQAGHPPTLRVQVNGQPFEVKLPKGAGDESVRGQPAKGRPHEFIVTFPARLLRAGDNSLLITTLTGSWMLYDWLGLDTPPGLELVPGSSQTVVEDVQPIRALVEKDGHDFQPVAVTLRHFAAPAEASVRIGDGPATTIPLKQGVNTAELLVPARTNTSILNLLIEVDGKTVATQTFTLKPVRKLTVYLLPHSHTDIGYTEIQSAVEAKQVNNLVEGMAIARRTAAYPAGARFVWNVEVLWAADLFLKRLDAAQRAEFLAAVKSGQVVLNGMYLNELTGLCRPEELLQLFRFATIMGQQSGVPVDAAMISDVPGYTWGTVTAMAQAGIKYFSTAPNYFDRIGNILREWENKPFYWVGPDGQSKVLVWIPFWGYAMSHRYGAMSPKLVDDFCDGLEQRGYPYDIAYARWSGHGDNAVPDPTICDFVKDWNARYAWPKFIISGTGEAFRALEQRYGAQLPQVRGDWTPYWEDGAGSSASETALNRASSDRLVQAETLFALRAPKPFAPTAFDDAWRNTLLYSEHTWGAWCSISEPERKDTTEQWDVKRSYALQADRQSRELLDQGLQSTATAVENAVDVWNTTSWPRTELVLLAKELSAAGDRVTDDAGNAVPSQRLTSGELTFLARDVPSFAARRYTVTVGAAEVSSRAHAEGNVLDNGILRLRIDERTGGIRELARQGLDGNFADTTGGESLNDYLYLPGDNLADLQRNGPVRIRVGEPGPLVASLIIESDAPGCKSLRREIRLVAGLDYAELINTVDKARLVATNYHDKAGKESVNFAFPFNVPNGDLVLDLPLGAMRPDDDQMPSACKNWFTVGRWADVSNRDRGITWVTLDAPLVEVGGLTANLLNSQTDPNIWRKQVGRTQKLYSWAMNNHWGTNYRAYQEGPTVFRFVLRPHRQPDPAEASRFATGFSQPLPTTRARGAKPPAVPRLRLEPKDIIVLALKPSDDGQAWIIRLLGASGKRQDAHLLWSDPAPANTWLSDLSQEPRQPAPASLPVPAWGVVTLRVSKP